MGDTEVDAARRAAFAAFRQSLSKGRKKAKPPSFDVVESTKPLVIKALLSREEIDSVFEAARQCGTTRSEATTRLAGFSARAKDDSGTAAQEAFATMGLAYDIAYSDAHVRACVRDGQRAAVGGSITHVSPSSRAQVALFMHRDGWLAREWPLLVAKLVHAMRSQEGDWGDREALCSATSVRCAEFHSYAESGGLLDENHRDLGSTLTMSVLLSDEQAQEARSSRASLGTRPPTPRGTPPAHTPWDRTLPHAVGSQPPTPHGTPPVGAPGGRGRTRNAHAAAEGRRRTTKGRAHGHVAWARGRDRCVGVSVPPVRAATL
jgi:hypothetical protein